MEKKLTVTSDEKYQLIIIGSGPAAYTAAIYAGRNNLEPLLLGGTNPGGQLLTTTEIENYPGLDAIGGFDLVDNMRKQAIKYGTIILDETVIDIRETSVTSEEFIVTTEDKSQYYAGAIIIATGANPNKLNVPGAEKFWGNGISSCAVCDGALPRFRNKVIVVVGGGDSAMEEATFLSKYASKVIIIHRKDKFRASKTMQRRILQNKKVEVVFNHEITSINGEKSIASITIVNNQTQETRSIECGGLFYAIGHIPNTQFIKTSTLNKMLKECCQTQLKLDEEGYLVIETIIANTSSTVRGIYVAGDVADKRYRQAITAAASGCMAAIDVASYLDCS